MAVIVEVVDEVPRDKGLEVEAQTQKPIEVESKTRGGPSGRHGRNRC